MADAPPALEHQQPRIPDVPAPNELPDEVQVRDAAAIVEQVHAMPTTPSACCAVTFALNVLASASSSQTVVGRHTDP